MRHHVEVELRVVMEHALAGLHVSVEGLGHEGRIGEQVRQSIGNLRQRARERLRFEDRVAFGAELFERIGHRGLLFCACTRLIAQISNLRIRRPRIRYGREKSMGEFGMLRAIALLAALGSALWSHQSRAEEPYPARTVRIVVPSAPGSTTDTLARIVADQLARKWAKSGIVENVAGGAMNAGAANGRRAAH